LRSLSFFLVCFLILPFATSRPWSGQNLQLCPHNNRAFRNTDGRESRFPIEVLYDQNASKPRIHGEKGGIPSISFHGTMLSDCLDDMAVGMRKKGKSIGGRGCFGSIHAVYPSSLTRQHSALTNNGRSDSNQALTANELSAFTYSFCLRIQRIGTEKPFNPVFLLLVDVPRSILTHNFPFVPPVHKHPHPSPTTRQIRSRHFFFISFLLSPQIVDGFVGKF
jgi:hypothetical protein